MEVRLSPEHERFVRQSVERGHYPSAAQVVEAALRLLEAREEGGPTQRAVALGVEQALAGRSAALTGDEVIRCAHRRRSRR